MKFKQLKLIYLEIYLETTLSLTTSYHCARHCKVMNLKDSGLELFLFFFGEFLFYAFLCPCLFTINGITDFAP